MNDRWGHVTGDSVLVEAAQRIEGSIRTTDTAARYGGDEFVVLCEDVRHEGEASAVAARLVDAFHKPFTIEGVEHAISASAGVAVGGAPDDLERLIDDADRAMYAGKARSREGCSLR